MNKPNPDYYCNTYVEALKNLSQKITRSYYGTQMQTLSYRLVEKNVRGKISHELYESGSFIVTTNITRMTDAVDIEVDTDKLANSLYLKQITESLIFQLYNRDFVKYE